MMMVQLMSICTQTALFDIAGHQLDSTGTQTGVIPEYFSVVPDIGSWLAITKANGNWYTINAPVPSIGTGIGADFFVDLFDRANSGTLNGNWSGNLNAYDIVSGTLQSVLFPGTATTAAAINKQNYIANLALTCQAPPAPDSSGYINTGGTNTYTLEFGDGGLFGVNLVLWTNGSPSSIRAVATAKAVSDAAAAAAYAAYSAAYSAAAKAVFDAADDAARTAYKAAVANLEQSTYCNLSITKNSATVASLTNQEVSTPQLTNFNLNIDVNTGTITITIGDAILSYSDTSVLRNCTTFSIAAIFSIAAMSKTNTAQIDSIKVYRGDRPEPPNQSGYGKYVPTAGVSLQYKDKYHTAVKNDKGVLTGYTYNPNA
jgi:hypothetical protein